MMGGDVSAGLGADICTVPLQCQSTLHDRRELAKSSQTDLQMTPTNKYF